MDGNPKSPIEIIGEDNQLIAVGSMEALTARWPPPRHRPVGQHAVEDQVIQRLGYIRQVGTSLSFI